MGCIVVHNGECVEGARENDSVGGLRNYTKNQDAKQTAPRVRAGEGVKL